MTLAKVMPKIRWIIGTAIFISFLFPYEKPLMLQLSSALVSGCKKEEAKSTAPAICPTKHGEIANCFNANRAKE